MSQEAPPVRKNARGSITLESVHAKQQKLLIKMQDVVHEDIITDKLRLK